MTECISIVTWIVCGLVIAEYTTNIAAKFLFGEKVEPNTALLLTEFL